MLHRTVALAFVCLLASCSAAEDAPKAPAPPAKGAPQLPDIRLDLKAGTVEIDGTFCVGEYPLELLVCQNTMKDYESMISSPAKPSLLHTALLALGLKPRVRDQKEPGRVLREGDPVDVLLRFTRDGKEVTVEPRELIVNVETKEHIAATPFVFFGSFLFPDPEDGKRMIYLGDSEQWLIGLLGDTASVIDLPPEAAGKYGALGIDTKVAPPKGSKVTVVMRPSKDRKPAGAPKGK
ncbi:MAG TPA: YdjY domain-containing protein [Planctomycetota bacterium]|nr:YdjY domain-containing protein [Planctomycetota bacterium]HRR82720.1 YdjY domain-containing protein [Planctomycetota bacterium]HRT95949.1 YdjY domain-containing protein [Planctomycetota bacterium]